MLGMLDYMAARQAATDARRSGAPRPWSSDPVIADRFLCSVVRDDDRTCREALAYLATVDDAEERWRLARCFRYLNHVPSWTEAHEAGVLGDAAGLAALLRAREARGEKYLGAQAFKINVKGGVWNIDGISQAVAGLYTHRWMRLEPTGRGFVMWALERKYSPFMSYQIMQDIRWTGHRYEDEDTWAWVGPGAARGLLRLAGTYGAPRTWESRRNDNQSIAMKSVTFPADMRGPMTELLAEAKSRLGAHINMHEIEHNLCEWDKYCRIATGESRGRRFVPREEKST